MINLLPLDIRTERQYGRKNRVLLGYVFALLITALIVAIVMIGGLTFFGTDSGSIKSEIEQNKIVIASLQKKTTELNTTVAKLDTVDNLYESGISFSELIPKIGSLLPEGAVLNALSLTGENTDTLVLDFDLETAELSAVLIRNLVDSDLFEAADVSSINPKGPEAGRYQFGANVSVSFEGAAAAKKKAEAAAKAAAARKAAEAESKAAE
jgi:Tfp pilus assembly protein PilN